MPPAALSGAAPGGAAPTAGERARRLPEIDALKVTGIVTVVLIHTLRAPWDPAVAPLEVWIGHATRFGVPAFLFASGFLYATTAPVPWATTRGRLWRILAPYLVASLLAQLFRRAWDHPDGTGSLALDLLIGASFGPYYYVFVIALLVLVTPAFARLSPRGALLLLLAFVAAQWATETRLFGLFELRWQIRSPTLWWAHFLLGWCVRLHEARVRRAVAARRGALLALFAAAAALLTGVSALEGRAPALLVRSAAWLDIYAILGLVFVLASRARGVPGWLRGVSDATYALYLYHLFFLVPLKAWLPPPENALAWESLLIPWALSLLLPLLLVAARRALLGARSRSVIGA